jgi:hypothetical protein
MCCCVCHPYTIPQRKDGIMQNLNKIQKKKTDLNKKKFNGLYVSLRKKTVFYHALHPMHRLPRCESPHATSHTPRHAAAVRRCLKRHSGTTGNPSPSRICHPAACIFGHEANHEATSARARCHLLRTPAPSSSAFPLAQPVPRPSCRPWGSAPPQLRPAHWL